MKQSRLGNEMLPRAVSRGRVGRTELWSRQIMINKTEKSSCDL